MEVFSTVLYTRFVTQFLFVGLILLFSLVAVVFLTETTTKKAVKDEGDNESSEKKQSLEKQVSREQSFLQIENKKK